MKKKNIKKTAVSSILFSLILLSCTFTGKSITESRDYGTTLNTKGEPVTQQDDGYFNILCNTPVSDARYYFYGFSPVFTNQETEKSSAFDSAVESALVFNGSKLSYTRTGLRRSFTVITDSGAEPGIRDQLEKHETFRYSSGFFGLYSIDMDYYTPQINALPSVFTAIEESVPWKEPSWIYVMPEIDGYMLSVGISGRYRNISESIKQADLNALEEMMKQKVTGVISDSSTMLTTGRGLEYSAAEISGFYIIKRWWPAGMNYFYSLAAAPE